MFRNLSPSVVTLNKITMKYDGLIRSNLALEDDARELVSCISLYPALAAKNCNKVIDHLIAEVKEETCDEQRIADESPRYVAECSDSCLHLQEHLDLKQDLEDFMLNIWLQILLVI